MHFPMLFNYYTHPFLHFVTLAEEWKRVVIVAMIVVAMVMTAVAE